MNSFLNRPTFSKLLNPLFPATLFSLLLTLQPFTSTVSWSILKYSSSGSPLFSLLERSLYTLGGSVLESIFFAILATASLLLLVFSLPHLNSLSRSFLLVLGSFPVLYLLGPKEQTLTFLLMALLLFLYQKSSSRLALLWLLPLLFWFFSFLTPETPLVLLIFLPLAFRHQDKSFPPFMLIFILSGFACLLTPGNLSLFLPPNSLDPLSLSPNFHLLTAKFLEGFFLLPLLLALFTKNFPKKWLFPYLLGLAVTFFDANAGAVLFALCLFLLAFQLPDTFKKIAEFLPGLTSLFQKYFTCLFKVICSLLALLLIFGLAYQTVKLNGKQKSQLPEAAALYVENNYPHTTVLTTYAWQGYLSYELTRNTIYLSNLPQSPTNSTSKIYNSLQTLAPAWQYLLASSNSQLAVLPESSALSQSLQLLNWKLVYTDSTSHSLVLISPALFSSR